MQGCPLTALFLQADFLLHAIVRTDTASQAQGQEPIQEGTSHAQDEPQTPLEQGETPTDEAQLVPIGGGWHHGLSQGLPTQVTLDPAR